MKRTQKEELKQVVGIYGELGGGELQKVLEERAKQAALSLGVELLEQEVEDVCGRRYQRKEESEAYRYGKEQTSIVIGGARYPVERSRMRGKEGEIYPEMLKKFREQDLLDEEMKERMLLGVSTRNYERVIEGYSDKVGVSRSSVSRAFQRASKKALEEINGSELQGYSFVGLVVDGIEIGKRTVIAAMGITEKLEKVPVGLVEGNTENSGVVTDLLTKLEARGFTLHCEKLLCIVDGGKALRKGILSVFGESAIIQRCWVHKLRNLQKYLPKEHHATLMWRMKKLMGLSSYTDAKKEMGSLRKWLENISYDAAQSLDEGGEALLSVHQLGVTGELRKTLTTTNMIESLFSVVRRKTLNVKNWNSRKTAQSLRWTASAILDHKQHKMRKLRGMNQRAQLIQALGISLDNQKISA